LPPYDRLGPVLQAYVEHDRSPEELIDDGTDPDLVWKVVGLVDQAEYKRRQAPPGVKITPKAFGRDRRLPITNWYRRTRPPMGPEGPISSRVERTEAPEFGSGQSSAIGTTPGGARRT